MIPEPAKPAVAFVVAHPDDVAFLMGGTAWLRKDRYQLHVICASQGERARRGPPANCSPVRQARDD